MKTIAWGDTSLPVTESYPELKDMEQLLQFQSLSLKQINYLYDKNRYRLVLFDGIQLEFREEELKTPMFRSESTMDYKLRSKELSINPDKHINRVSVEIDERNYISAIRFNYKEGGYVIEALEDYYETSSWETRDIPEGY